MAKKDPNNKVDQVGAELGKAISDSLIKAVNTAFSKLDFTIVGKQIGQGLVPELNKVLKITNQLAASTNNYTRSFNTLSNSYQSLVDNTQGFFNIESRRMRDIAHEREQLELQHRTGLNDIFLLKAIQLQQEGKMTEAAMQASIALLRKRQQREQDSIVNNQLLAQAIELGQAALNNRFILQQEISALESESLQGLRGEFAVQAAILTNVGQLTNEKKAQLLLAQQEQQSLERKKYLLLDLKQANEEYQRAVRQANADIDLKTLVMKLGLTEDETSQMARLYMEQNKQNGLAEDLTVEQVKQLQQQDKSLRHKREEVELIEYQANWQRELNEEIGEYGKSWEKLKGKLKAIVTDPKFAKAFFAAEGIKTAVEGLESMEKRFDVLKKSGLAAGQAAQGMVKTISTMSIIGLSDTEGVMQGMVEHYGNVNALSADMVDDLGKMAVHMGITGQEAMKLNAALSQMPGETAKSAKNAMHHVGHLAEMKGIAPGKIMKDMANNTAEMARAGSKGAEAFGKSVINLHKMGVEMSTASKIAEGLLDFETSLNRQMEASVLLGREINLDKARELALNNDLEGATREVLKNVGGTAEFNKLNRMQQNALASSLGLTVEEMAKYIDAQEEQEKYHGKAAGFWMNVIGYGTEYGTAMTGFFKQHGLLLLSGLTYMKQFGGPMTMLKDGWKSITGAIGTAVKGMQGLATGGFQGMREAISGAGAAGSAGAEAVGGAVDRTRQVSQVAEREPKAKSGQGTRDFLTNLAEGLKAMGNGKVLLGAINMIPASLGLVAMIPGVAGAKLLEVLKGEKVHQNLIGLAHGLEAFGNGKVTAGGLNLVVASVGLTAMIAGSVGAMAIQLISGERVSTNLIQLAAGLQAMSSTFVGSLALGAFAVAATLAIPSLIFLGGVSLLGIPAAAGLAALGGGLAAFGATAPVAIIGIGLIALLGAAMIPFAAALLIATPAVEAFGNIIIGVLQQVPPIIQSIASGFATMLGAMSMDKIAPLMVLPLVLTGLGVGFMTLGAGVLLAAPGLFVLSGVLPIISAGLMMIASATSSISATLPNTIAHLSTMAAMVPALMGVAGALLAISSGLGAVALAGALALPVLGALTALSVLAPQSVDTLGGTSKEDRAAEDSFSEELGEKLAVLIEEVKGLRKEMAKGGVVNMDGRKVGDTLRLFGINSSGIR